MCIMCTANHSNTRESTVTCIQGVEFSIFGFIERLIDEGDCVYSIYIICISSTAVL